MRKATIVRSVLIGVLVTLSFSAQSLQTCNSGMPESTPISRYLDNGDSTITDVVTGLMWKKCAEGLSGETCVTGNSSTYLWPQALQYVQNINNNGGDLGYIDWRLPNIKELASIVEYRCVWPAINTNVFPNTPIGLSWTSSPNPFGAGVYIDYENGQIGMDYGALAHIRLVRDAAPTTTPLQAANGIWEGTFTEIGVGTYAVTGLLYNGQIIAISELAGAIYVGSYTVSGDNISGNVTAYQINGSPYATATLSGTVSEQATISVAFNTSYGSNGTMSLAFNSIYNRASSFSLMQGIWNHTDGAYSLPITAQNDGTFSGQDSDGCVVSGALGIIDTARNLYTMNVQVQFCGPLDGSYSGYAGLFDGVSLNDTLYTAVSSSNFLLFYSFTRQ